VIAPLQEPLPFPETRVPSSELAAAEGIEARFDVPFVAQLALKEKQIQQNVRPVIAVHKWFARRPGTLFRALILAEFAQGPLAEIFDRPHQLPDLRIADPFMGGGTPLLEANRLGCEVVGWDVNPMAWWIVRQEIADLDVDTYLETAAEIEQALDEKLGSLYRTRCLECGDPEAPVKYFLWVKTRRCRKCERGFDLFPGYLVAADQRHPTNVLICPECGDLSEVEDRETPGNCAACSAPLSHRGPASRNRCPCPHCGEINPYADPDGAPPVHRMVALEYHCPTCRPDHRGRFFKKPEPEDLERFAEAERRLSALEPRYIPTETIPDGDETARLHRWGYREYRQMFNARQLLGLELLARRISSVRVENTQVREALATNLSDLLRYQNMLCRYDTRALKSLDVFSVHGYPVGLVQCESNLLGIRNGELSNVGSGGWSNIVNKFTQAKRYCEAPFEIRYDGRRKRRVAVPGEWIGERRRAPERRVELVCGSATEAELEPESLDAVLTDPPYLANVQYAELMDFCYAWLRRLAGQDLPELRNPSAYRPGDLTGNQTRDRGLEHFSEGLSQVFTRLTRALKRGRPFVFTYHHNELEAYLPVALALLDAGLVCTATLPCPAEMGGSIHIHKTGSSIVDTVFVCRTEGAVLRRTVEIETPALLAELVAEDLEELRRGGITPTSGDAKCLTFGHLTQLAVWKCRNRWNPSLALIEKLRGLREVIANLPAWAAVSDELVASSTYAESGFKGQVSEGASPDSDTDPEIPFHSDRASETTGIRVAR